MEDHPGFATDLLFDRYQGEVTDHDAFWTVRTRALQTTTSATTCCCPLPQAIVTRAGSRPVSTG